jgi:hypothetical protein
MITVYKAQPTAPDVAVADLHLVATKPFPDFADRAEHQAATMRSDCDFCGGRGDIDYEDPVTGWPASMLCPTCTPDGADLEPHVERPDEYEWGPYDDER